MQTRIKIEGDEWWGRVLRSGAPRILAEEMGDAAKEGTEYLQAEAQKYPPPPEGSRYVRTFQLQRGWQQSNPRLVFGGSGFQMVAENPTPYAPFVQDPDRQAWQMKHWRTTEQIEQDAEARITGLFERAIQRAESRITTEGDG